MILFAMNDETKKDTVKLGYSEQLGSNQICSI